MALTARLSLTGPPTSDPEDLFSSALAVIFPDDVAIQHGDADHGLLYTSPHLPKPLPLALADVSAESDRYLFSHYLWNSSLLLAELVEAGTLGLDGDGEGGYVCDQGVTGLLREGEEGGVDVGAGGGEVEEEGGKDARALRSAPACFDVTGLATLELGAGTALPSILAGLLGARRVVVTDYPSPPVLATLRKNVAGVVRPEFAPAGRMAVEKQDVLVDGHGWGELDTDFARANKGAFDRVMAADCLWMPWQHDNLRQSIAWFLGHGEGARAWVVAGFHTGRDKVGAFFEREELEAVGLEVERLWERDCDGKDRKWIWDRGVEDSSDRKRWLAVGVLRRIRTPAEGRERSS